MTTEQIRKQIGLAEDTELEYKSAQGGFPESFWETFSSFANTNGGIIVLGVKDKNQKIIPDGLDETLIAKYKKVFWGCAHNKKGWADNKWPQPKLSERTQPDECLMTLALEGGEENVRKEQNDLKNGTKDGTKELTERQVLILRLIEADGTITTRDLTQKTGMSQRTLLRELAALQEMGVLAREGGRKGGRWIIKDEKRWGLIK